MTMDIFIHLLIALGMMSLSIAVWYITRRIDDIMKVQNALILCVGHLLGEENAAGVQGMAEDTKMGE